MRENQLCETRHEEVFLHQRPGRSVSGLESRHAHCGQPSRVLKHLARLQADLCRRDWDGAVCVRAIGGFGAFGPRMVPRPQKSRINSIKSGRYGGERGIGSHYTKILGTDYRPNFSGPGEGLITTAFGRCDPCGASRRWRSSQTLPWGEFVERGSHPNPAIHLLSKKGTPRGALFD